MQSPTNHAPASAHDAQTTVTAAAVTAAATLVAVAAATAPATAATATVTAVGVVATQRTRDAVTGDTPHDRGPPRPQ